MAGPLAKLMPTINLAVSIALIPGQTASAWDC